jgi:hypothetical protein
MEAFMAMGSSFSFHPTAASTPRPAAAPAAPAATGNSEFLTTEEAGGYLRLSPRTLEKQRVLGGGPRFRKFGARVVYAVADLRAWADSRSYGMTSDPGYVQRDSVR